MKDPNTFIADFSVEGMFHALTIRSPVARGVLKGIVHPKLPDSFYLITAEYIHGENSLADFPVPVLADKNLSYIGQPVAILAGPDIPVLEELASLIRIDTEEETPAFSDGEFPLPENAGGEPAQDDNPEGVSAEIEAAEINATETDTSVETEAAKTDTAETSNAEIDATEIDAAETGAFAESEVAEIGAAEISNAKIDVIVERDITHGDMSLLQGGKLFSGTYTTGIQEHWYAEPHGAAAVPSAAAGSKNRKGKKAEETLMIYTATQWPYHVKRSAARVLGWDSEKIAVTPTVMTPHLDGKLWYPSLVACHAALAALITKRPVKLMLTKEDDFRYSPKRNASKIEIRTNLGEKNEILGTSVRVNLDLGSAGVFEDEIMDETCLGSLGLYHHEAVKIRGAGIRTNIPPQGPMAGFGLSQGFFAAERQASRIADALGQDPAEWRKKNFLRKGQSFAAGQLLKDAVPLSELIDAAASMSDYYRKWVSYELLRTIRRKEKWRSAEEPLRGIGISVACQGNGFLYNADGNNCAVELTLEKDGVLEIKTSLVSFGSIADIWRDLAQEILGVAPESVRFTVNTAGAPDSGPATLSKTVSPVTKLVERCCIAIRKQRFRDPLPITVKRSVKQGKTPGWVPGKIIDPEAFAHPSWGAAVVEIEIDPVSFSPVIRGVWLAVDAGKILSQRRARRILTTGINHALGWAFREHVYYRDGIIDPALFRSFNIPAPAEIPPISVDFIWNDSADPKGIGDLPFNCVPAAYVQAVSQAMDHPFENIPLRVDEIWDVRKSKQTESGE